MADFLKKLTGFFAYKEPSNKELGFELLEDANEGNNSTDQQNSSIPIKQQPQNHQQAPQQQAPQQQNEQQAPHKDNTQQSGLKESADSVQQAQRSGKRKHKTPVPADQWAKKKQDERIEQQPQCDQSTICPDLKTNLDVIKNKFNVAENMDVIIREFNVGRKLKAFLVFIENMIDKQQLNLSLLPQLMDKDVFGDSPDACPVDYLIENVIAMRQVRKTNQYHEAVTIVLCGGSALFIEGCNECVIIKTFGAEKRPVEKPITENVIQGCQEGFTESMDTNVSLIRKNIRNENLVVKFIPVGNTNHSQCAVMYLKGVANESVVTEVMKRIKKISASYIAGSCFIEEFIEDNPLMLLPQMINTERPDRIASFIMDGMVTIIGEGTPRVIAAPCTFFRLMHTSEDTNVRWPFGTFLRLVRYLGLITSVFLPGMYVALILFHTEMLPTEMLVSIATAKEAVPLPTLIEVLILELSFEMVREGAIRVPGVIGQTLGIVGALILGQAAVSANLVNPVTVIIVSLTSIGSFTIPNYELSLGMRVIRFFFIIAGAVLGFYGISIMLAIFLMLACSMKSFGVPYFAPVAPKTKSKNDTLLRKPIFSSGDRSDALNTPDRASVRNNVKNWTYKQPSNGNGGGS